jgi:hypothetical protein
MQPPGSGRINKYIDSRVVASVILPLASANRAWSGRRAKWTGGAGDIGAFAALHESAAGPLQRPNVHRSRDTRKSVPPNKILCSLPPGLEGAGKGAVAGGALFDGDDGTAAVIVDHGDVEPGPLPEQLDVARAVAFHR